MRLSPLGPDAFWLEHYLSQAYYLIGRYEDAVGWGRMSAAHAGANTSNLRSLITSLVALGEMDEARTVAQRLLQLVPTFRLTTFRARTPLRGDSQRSFRRTPQNSGSARVTEAPQGTATPNHPQEAEHARELRW